MQRAPESSRNLGRSSRAARLKRPSLALAVGLLALVAGPAGAGAKPTVSEYQSGHGPAAATLGPDGNVWFVEGAANKIGRVSPDGTVVEFSAGLAPFAGLADIAGGPDGNLWFTESIANRIGRITPAGEITEFSAGITFAGSPHGIAAGADGNLWFTEAVGSRIGRITPAGAVTEFSAGIRAASMPWGIAAGPDGNLWFTQHAAVGGIARITPDGVVTQFGPLSGSPSGIVSGPDGNVWFAESASQGRIGRITPAGSISEFSKGLSGGRSPEALVSASDGNLYFSETGDRGTIGKITPDGTIGELTHDLDKAPFGLATGTDGNVWFTEPGADRVGRVTIAPLATTGPASAITTAGATLAGTVGPNSQPTTYHFEWGLTTAYGSSTPAASAGSAAQPQAVSTAISGLTAFATYHFRVVASNPSGTTYGQDATYVASGIPATGGSAVQTPGLPRASRPAFGRSATVQAVSGSVLVERRDGRGFARLRADSTVPNGTTIDATRGVVRLTNVRRRGGTLQTGTFWGGAFRVAQARDRHAYTVIALTGKLVCRKGKARGSAAVSPPKPKPHLWGRDDHGRFITRGHTAVATVRGTAWLTTETCRGTVVKVKRGVVSVRDLVRHRTVRLTAGRSYLARRR